jgi:CO/xanthine dehydrogenase FAD-binding subunit
VAGLDALTAGPEGVVAGALVRTARLLRDAEVAAAHPLLVEATGWIAHGVIRNRGTVGGSLAHADPAAELPAVLAVLDGSVEVVRWRDDALATRRIGSADLFEGPLMTTLEPDELLVTATFPALAPRTGWAVEELARRHGDYALCGVGALVRLDGGLRVEAARAALISVGPVPVPVDLTDALAGQPHDAADWAAAGRLAAAAVEPEDDIHATAAYRRHLAGVLTARAARAAAASAADRLQGAA